MDLLQIVGTKLFGYFDRNLELKELEKEKLSLGIMVVLMNLSKLILILLIAMFFGWIKQVAIMSVELTLLRMTAAGIHSKSNFICTLISIFVYIGGTYISVDCLANPHFAFWVSSICVILLYKYSPSDTENRPILGEKHRKKLKVITMINAVMFIVINLLLKSTELFNLTMICLISETVSILPCTYKLFNESYDNYKRYEVG